MWLRSPAVTGDLTVTFHGVRGSTPCDGEYLARYGGNTSCVALEREGEAPIVFDLGTGLRNYGTQLLEEQRAGMNAFPTADEDLVRVQCSGLCCEGRPTPIESGIGKRTAVTRKRGG